MRALLLTLCAGCNLVADLGGYEVVSDGPTASGGAQAGGRGGDGGGAGHGAASQGGGGEAPSPCGPSPCTGAHVWSRRYGGTLDAYAAAVAVDAGDGVVLVGDYAGDLAFDAVVVQPTANAGDVNAFAASIDAGGAVRWAFGTGGVAEQHAADVAVAPDGSIVMVGWFTGNLGFGGAILSKPSGYDGYVVKLDAAGVLIWQRQIGSTLDYAQALTVAVAPGGEIHVGGRGSGSVVLAPGVETTALGGLDGYVAKLAADGTPLWAQSLGGPSNEIVAGLVVAPDGDLVLAGNADGDINVGGSTLGGRGLVDVWVARYDAGLLHRWSKRFGGVENDEIGGLALDPDGRSWLSGAFRSTELDFGGRPMASNGESDGFVAALGLDGQHLWSGAYGDASDQVVHALATDGLGNVLVGGKFAGTIAFGGDPWTTGGMYDAFLAKIGPSGQHRWSVAYGTPAGPADQAVTAIERDSTGGAVVAGMFAGNVNLGGGPLTSAGGFDVFVGKLAP
jgi:hypothetical protein